MTFIFLDANVPIYAAGRPHALKAPCARVLELAAQRRSAFMTDAEVLQELLHRYLALRLWSQGQIVFRSFAQLMEERVRPVEAEDVELAASLAERHVRLSARDLLHIAVMLHAGVATIVSADRAFETVRGITRFDPAEVAAWTPRIGA